MTVEAVPGQAQLEGASPNDSPTASGGDLFSPFINYVNCATQRDSIRPLDHYRAHLRLMHHYTAVTWSTLPQGLDRQEIWQIALPTLAIENDFLLHQLLAISAFHYAFLHPQSASAYSIQAAQYQSTATDGLRTIISNITKDNCHAVFASASLLTITAFATHGENSALGRADPGLDSLLEVFSLLRGMHSILRDWEHDIEGGPVGKLLRLSQEGYENPFLTNMTQTLQHKALTVGESASVEKTFRDELVTLSSCIKYSMANSTKPELRVVTLWPIYFSDDFLSLLHSRHATAMEILGHYLEILRLTGLTNWYLKGWGRSVQADIGGRA